MMITFSVVTSEMSRGSVVYFLTVKVERLAAGEYMEAEGEPDQADDEDRAPADVFLPGANLLMNLDAHEAPCRGLIDGREAQR